MQSPRGRKHPVVTSLSLRQGLRGWSRVCAAGSAAVVLWSPTQTPVRRLVWSQLVLSYRQSQKSAGLRLSLALVWAAGATWWEGAGVPIGGTTWAGGGGLPSEGSVTTGLAAPQRPAHVARHSNGADRRGDVNNPGSPS